MPVIPRRGRNARRLAARPARLKHLIELVDRLEERGIAFKSVTEEIDTTSAGGRLTFHIFGALAEFERQIIRERTRAGVAAARARNRVGGRPRSVTPEKLAAACAMRDQDHTKPQIAKALGVSVATLYRHLPTRSMTSDERLEQL